MPERSFFTTKESFPQNPEREILRATQSAEKEFGQNSTESFEAAKLQMRRLGAMAAAEKSKDAEAIVLNLSPESHDTQMEELVGIMREKGLKKALAVLYGLKSYHLEDDFHRFLVQYLKSDYGRGLLKEKSDLSRVLRKTLYEVSLPQIIEEGKTMRELISGMEQFYAGMLAISDAKSRGKISVSFEIALPHVGQEVSFYVAVPDDKRDLFEKQLLSIFPTAKVREETDDYNIFNPQGATVGTFAKFNKSEALSLKTYDEFDHDPLNVILNAFSRLKKEGEGAALQIIFSPQEDFYNKRYAKALERINKGESSKEVLDFDSGMLKGFGKIAKDIFSTSNKSDGDKTPETEVAEEIRRKIQSPVVAGNLRIVASADSEVRADSILSEIKAAFNQFEKTGGNSIKFQKLKGRGLSKMLRRYSFREFTFDENIPLSIKELTSIFHFTESTLKSSDNLKQAKANTAPAPVNLAPNGILLGVNRHRGEEKKVFYGKEDRLRHFYTIGQTGTGKTTLLKNMIIQDIRNGEGICVVDPHGSDMEDILANIPPERAEDVVYFDPGNIARPMGLNMLEYDINHPEQKTFVVDEMLSIFNKLFDMKVAGGPAFEQYFRNSALLIMDDPQSGSTMLEIARVLSDPSFRRMKLEKTNNPIIKQFWQNAEKTTGDQALANFVPYITSKFDNFLNNEYMRPIIAQQKSAFNFREIMDNKKILLVNLSKGRLGDLNSNLLGLIIVGKILMAALSRVDSLGKDLAPFYLYIDEFQNVTTSSISTILSEARKYKLSLNIAHQFIAQLDEKIRDSVFGNVGSIAAFRVGAKDAEYLESQFEPVFDAHDLLNVDNRHAFLRLLIDGRPARPFSLETLASPAGERALIPHLKELSALKYGRPRADVEAEILRKYGLG